MTDWRDMQREAGCDADSPPSYISYDGKIECRCMICARCNRHTGNSHQGHYWAMCKVTGTKREHHFCCPGNCELEAL